ncbi:hypothetical protein [Leifsonia soli]|uniref:Zf-HC2 domain-containing protein n=1 Tax=Leifsonia soli TaxID=582665 RepID=A0A852T6F8_9MICO|nr:hypothetical protein [Leifsonia soli]NYD76040.1 hypothetical protein [Leifsonia soli]
MSNASEWIDRFLAADPEDVGCDEVMAVMHIYVDLRAAGVNPEDRYPGVAAHLAACRGCADDVAGLLEIASDKDFQLRPPSVEG